MKQPLFFVVRLTDFVAVYHSERRSEALRALLELGRNRHKVFRG